jgi:uncharacterized membrane protein YccF (DUF307 family)
VVYLLTASKYILDADCSNSCRALRRHTNSPLRLVFNVLWLVLCGWEIALAHLALAIVLAITVVGLPFAFQHLKLIPLCLLPFGRELR